MISYDIMKLWIYNLQGESLKMQMTSGLAVAPLFGSSLHPAS